VIKAYNGIKMLLRDLLFIIECTRCIIIMKANLIGLLLVIRTSGRKYNILTSVKIQFSTHLISKNMHDTRKSVVLPVFVETKSAH